MYKSLKTDSKEEDEQLELLHILFCCSPRKYNRFRASEQTFVEKMLQFASEEIRDMYM